MGASKMLPWVVPLLEGFSARPLPLWFLCLASLLFCTADVDKQICNRPVNQKTSQFTHSRVHSEWRQAMSNTETDLNQASQNSSGQRAQIERQPLPRSLFLGL